MLEALISSRIRRSLLEYVLSHSSDRFYLRGLAKELQLPISPLRRELKRLEQVGMLRGLQEGNMVFYTVNVQSQQFMQLQRAGLSTEAPSVQLEAQGSRLKADRSSLQPSALSLQRSSIWRSPLSSPALIAATGVGMMLVLVVAGIGYLTITNSRLASQISKAFAARKAEVNAQSASGTMRGSRWQIVPGGFGGFSSGASNESY